MIIVNSEKEHSKKDEGKLTYEKPFQTTKDVFTLSGLEYTNTKNPENDSLYKLSKTILEKLKYRKLFLKESFNSYVLKKIQNSISNLQNTDLYSNPTVKWITIYKWMLRKRIPYIDDFINVKTFSDTFDDIPFFKEWCMSIDLLYNELNERDINYIDALEYAYKLKLLKEKYYSIFCHNYKAHIVYDCGIEDKFLKDGKKLHADCDGSFFKGKIYEIKNDFYEFWFRSKGKTLELWFYYVLMYYIRQYKKSNNFSIYRNVGVFYNDPTKPMTEIDIMVKLNNKVVPCECKNTEDIDMGMILKFYGTLKMLKFKYGIFACTAKFKEYIIPKELLFKKYGILIVDDLINKDKNTILDELKKII